MTNQRAAEILENMLDLLDPDNPPASNRDFLQRPEVMLALHKAILALRKEPIPFHSQKSRPIKNKIAPNSGKSWSSNDDQILRYMYKDSAPLHIICEKLGRSPNSILARMVHLGCISNRNDYPRAENLSAVMPDIWSSHDISQLKTCYLNGMTISQLATEFDTSEKAIEARLFYMGLSNKAPDPHLTTNRTDNKR